MRVLFTIQGSEVMLHPDGRISFLADADIDCDGVGADGKPNNIDHDPYYQPDTSLHHNGQALDAYTVPYIVVPPAIIQAVKGVVLGCQARLTYRETGQSAMCVVGDIGPRLKIGECSVKAARVVGMPSNPNTGGCDDPRLCLYELWPGKAGLAAGVQYKLQAS